jgi:serine/threonine protein kinase
MPLAPDTRLGRYEIRSKLGEGGMGEVYLAHDTQLRRPVALKLLPAEFSQSKERLRRFEQEAYAVAALNHPNIAHIYEIGETEGLHFIAMEYVDGETLREQIYRRGTPLPKLLRYLQHVAEGLAKAHAAGVVHRDLKPENIMVTGDGHAKILDFGLAKLVEPQQPVQKGGAGASEVATAILQQHSTPGVVLGTVGYMSPEQAQGKTAEIDQRSDIFSFGCILFEAATGRKAFEGKDALDSLHKIVHAPTPQISEINPNAPQDLQRIVRRCLAKEPEKRYQSIKDVAIELDELRQELKQRSELEYSVRPESTGGGRASGPQEVKAGGAQSAAADTTPIGIARPTSSAEYIVGEIKRHKLGAAIVIGLLIVAVAVTGIWIYRSSTGGQKKSAPSQAAKLQRLTSSGKASDAAISPDGKYVAHVKSDSGQQGLWLRQVATTSDTQIVPPSTQIYFGITFSKDGDYIYYALGERTAAGRTLYQVPALGGASRKVIESVSSPVSLSPDGTRLAFIRATLGRGESALVVANADGTGERQIAMRMVPYPFNNGGPSWSPDGKRIASCVIAQGSDGAPVMRVVELQVESGAESPIISQDWPPQNLPQVAWLTDGSGLLLHAAERGSASSQIWHISYPGGEVRKITNDLNNYNRLSLTADSSTLVTIQTEGASSVWVAPEAEAVRARQISAGRYDGQGGLVWMTGGKIVHASRESGLMDIWTMDQDGKNPKQLTKHAGDNTSPCATADGRYIVFTSTRSRATRSIWRMDADGGNLKQLTEGPGDLFPQSSPDGRWVVFHSQRSGSLRVWKVSIDGGEPVRLTDKWTANPTVSPDGTLVACFYREDQPNAPVKVAIIPFAGGDPVKVLDLPRPSFTGPAGLRWTPDGRALTYIDTINGVSNIWSLPLDGGQPVQLTDFKTDQIFWFDFSRDGKQLALSRGTQTSDVVLIRDFR